MKLSAFSRSRTLCSLVVFLFLVTFSIPVPQVRAAARELVSSHSHTGSLLPAEEAVHEHEEDGFHALPLPDTSIGFLLQNSALSGQDPEFAKPENPGNGNGGGNKGGGNDGGGGGETSGPKIRKVKDSGITESSVSITWDTNAPSDSQVEYGTTASYGNFSALDSSLVTSHEVTLTGLQPDTLYHYRVLSRDEQGNLTQSDDYTFTTAPLPDTVPPVISNVRTSDVTDTAVTILWETDEPADARVEYGLTDSYGNFSSLDSSLDTRQSITLTGLSPDRLHHFRVISRDSQGNETVSGDFTFTTEPASSAPDPAVVFLDFDGTYLANWGSYSDLTIPAFNTDGDATSFNSSEQSVIDHVFSAIIEKFSIFNVLVTLLDPFMPGITYEDPTEEFLARDAYYETNGILQVAIGGSSSGVLGISAGGVAYVDSFTNSIENTVLVFPESLANTDRYIWEASAHEAGHGFGLRHQSLYDEQGRLIETYNPGADGVAPIMGNSYNKRGLWWEGTSTSSTTIQNDFEVIAREFNGFGYRPDEYGDTPLSAAAFPDVFGTSFGSYGVINSAADEDYFEFTLTEAGAVNFTAAVNPYGAMLDLVLEIRDASDNRVVAADTSSLGETLSNVNLAAGSYYLVVRSKAAYLGDAGRYWIDGTVPPGTTTTEGPDALSGSGAFSSGQTESGGLDGSTLFSNALPAGALQIFMFADHYRVFPETEKAVKQSVLSEPMALKPVSAKTRSQADRSVKDSGQTVFAEVAAVPMIAVPVVIEPVANTFPATTEILPVAGVHGIQPAGLNDRVWSHRDKTAGNRRLAPSRTLKKQAGRTQPLDSEQVRQRLLRLLAFFPLAICEEIVMQWEGTGIKG